MKIKQNEIDLERKMRESEEQRRHAEHLFNEKLIREKDCQIEDQNKILNWHVGILTEQKALLEKVRLPCAGQFVFKYFFTMYR